MSIINENLSNNTPACNVNYQIQNYGAYTNLLNAFNVTGNIELAWESLASCTAKHIAYFSGDVECRYYIYDANGNAIDVAAGDYFSFVQTTDPIPFSGFVGIKLIKHSQNVDPLVVYLVYEEIHTCFSQTVEECFSTGTVIEYEHTINFSDNRDSCIAIKKRWAKIFAEQEFNKQKDAFISDLINDHINTCLTELDEIFTVEFNKKEHHYTLYYYDQAGNLVQTIPPEGVNPLDASHFPSGVYDNSEPEHIMKTQYKYNSLGQLIWQKTPDAGISNFYYNDLQQLRFSQNAQQVANTSPTYSYTKYDELNRITEVGESSYEPSDISLKSNLNSLLYPLQCTTNVYNQQITNMYYDEQDNSVFPFTVLTQVNLRNRVAYITTDYNGDGTYEHASHYSYY